MFSVRGGLRSWARVPAGKPGTCKEGWFRGRLREMYAAAHLDRMGPIGGIEFLLEKPRQNTRDSDFFDGGRVQTIPQRTAAKEPKPNAAVAVFNTC